MRKSKSIPAKCTRNYRSISQRRMTNFDGLDEDAEMERLRNLLRNSKSHLEEPIEPAKPKKRQRPEKVAKEAIATETTEYKNENEERPASPKEGLLSEELLAELGEDADVIVTSKKKPKTKKRRVELTPQEIRQAKLLQKNTERKLKQLEQRKMQKEKRAELYGKLKETAISTQEMELLSSSSTLGKKATKRDRLKQALQKERAGIELTEKEKDLLYKDRAVPEPDNAQYSTDTLPLPEAESRKTESEPTAKVAEKSASFASQMMMSLSQLKTNSVKMAEDAQRSREEEKAKALKDDEKKQLSSSKKYVPTETAVLKSAATLGLEPSNLEKKKRVLKIERPEDVKASRLNLPVAEMEFEVMDTVRNNDVTIIAAETGSGKSTQIPQMLYEGGMTLSVDDARDDLLIGVTQPRRVAAVSTAKRVSYEMGQSNGKKIPSKKGKGSLVAYQTRYETAGLGKSTRIKMMTDGVLLQEIQADLLLRKYAVILLDEAHERNLNTDVLIGLLSAALPLRREAALEDKSLVPLKVVIMSATLRVSDFQNPKLFASPPALLKIPGRTFPVTIHHSKKTELEKYEDAAFDKVRKIHRKLPPGGILVFLTGKQEIVRMVKRLRKCLCRKKIEEIVEDDVAVVEGLRDMDDDEADADLFHEDEEDFETEEKGEATDVEEKDGLPQQEAWILPLYSLLSAKEQAKVFDPPPENHRLIVVATNVAETSITIPGISYVVDTGRQKCRNYNSVGVASYDVMWISKAAADQRAGRAGRVGPGHCYRLYSSSLYHRELDAFELPEVLARPLEDVVLTMKTMNINNVSDFAFCTPPTPEQIVAAENLLERLGCTEEKKATRLGRAVAQLPVGVRLGKLLLVAAQAGVLEYGLSAVAALSESSPFVKPGQQDEESGDETSDEEAAEKKAPPHRWSHRGGDVLAMVLAVGAHHFAGKGAGGHAEQLACRRFCRSHGLQPVVMERIAKLRQHLHRLAATRMSNVVPNIISEKPPNALQQSLLQQAIASGFLDHVAMLAPLGSIPGTHSYSLRGAYSGITTKTPLFMDRSSVLHSRDSRQMPQCCCYESLQRKVLKDGSPIFVMKNVTAIDLSWLANIAQSSSLLKCGQRIPDNVIYKGGQVWGAVETRFGDWPIPPKRNIVTDYMWFARFFLEGKVIDHDWKLNDKASVITNGRPMPKTMRLVSSLERAQVSNEASLHEQWRQDALFLWAPLQSWTSVSKQEWREMVESNIITQ